MAINLNVSPYYDDFDANKKFNRVVFKAPALPFKPVNSPRCRITFMRP